jgi:predicted transcriptional regulator
VELLFIINKVSRKIAPGRDPSFSEAHVIKAVEIMGRETLGRIRLSKELGLGEGTTRTLLKHLKNEGVIEVSRHGIVLSERGKQLFSDLRSKMSEGAEIPPSSLTVGPCNVAVLVRDMAHKVKQGLEQRDTAIKAGALGATTLIFSSNEITVPSLGKEEAFKGISAIRDLLAAKLDPRKNDIIIIGSAGNRMLAEFGAKAAAFELLKSERQNTS